MALGEFAYAQNSNRFLAAAPLTDQPFAVVGVPYDGAVTHRPGARFGPQAMRAASLMLCDGTHPVFDVSPLPTWVMRATCACPMLHPCPTCVPTSSARPPR